MTVPQPSAPTEVKPQLDGSVLEITDIPISLPDLGVPHTRVLRKEQLADVPPARRGTLLSLCHDLFITHWNQTVFGPCIQGAVFELQLAEEAKQFSYLDGYLTVFLTPSPAHMHLCIGPHQGLKNAPTPPTLAAQRQCARAAFVRTLAMNGVPSSWSVQLWNGLGEQMITFFLPSPFLDAAREKRLREPEWSHLGLWNELRARYLSEEIAQPLPLLRPEGVCGG
jgi:hypothetical protein